MSKLSLGLGHVGNCASFVCAIHCIAMPFVIALLPAIGMTLAHGWVEQLILGVAIVCSLLSLCWGYATHRQLRVFAFLIAGGLWMYMGLHDARLHLIGSIIGGGCLIVANIMNRRLCRTCSSCKGH